MLFTHFLVRHCESCKGSFGIASRAKRKMKNVNELLCKQKMLSYDLITRGLIAPVVLSLNFPPFPLSEYCFPAFLAFDLNNPSCSSLYDRLADGDDGCGCGKGFGR